MLSRACCDALLVMQLCAESCRPALLAGMQLDVADVARVRETWMLHHGLSLPAKVRIQGKTRLNA